MSSLLLSCLLLAVGSSGISAQSLERMPSQLFGSIPTKQMIHWVDSVYQTLSLEEQVGQLIMPIVYPSSDPSAIGMIERRIKGEHWGGILYQKGMLAEQSQMNSHLQRASRIPLLIALDGEWGLYMRLKDAPRYPRNMGLGYQQDNQLLYNYGREIARQCRLMGIHINFAPDVDVNINPRNPVIGTRSFGDDPKVVAERALAWASGLEDGGVLSVAKHFPGHGDTSEDSHKTLPLVSASKKRMQEVELYPFSRYIRQGLGGVMTAHLRVPAYESSPIASSLSYAITTELLRDQMGFRGLVFTDGLEMRGVQAGGLNIGVQALLAGNDILLGPSDPLGMLHSIVEAVNLGTIPRELVRERCRRVLAYKYALIVSRPTEVAQPSEVRRLIYTTQMQEQQRALWRASLYFKQRNMEVERKLTSGLYKHIAVVDIGRNPVGNVPRPRLGKKGVQIDYVSSLGGPEDLAQRYDFVLINAFSPATIPTTLVARLASKCPTALVYYISPYKVPSGEWQQYLSLLIVAMEAAPEAQLAVLSLLSDGVAIPSASGGDDWDPTATMQGAIQTSSLASSSPGGNIAGSGEVMEALTPLSSPSTKSVFPYQELERLVQSGIHSGAFPGCQMVVLYRGSVVLNRAWGSMTGSVRKDSVTTEILYDVASMTKALATTPAAMLLVAEGKLRLDGRVRDYLPSFASSPVGGIRVRDLLLHQSGLVPGINFYTDLQDSENLSGTGSFLPTYISTKRSEEFPLQFARGLYLAPNFRDLMLQRIASSRLRTPGRYSYSDINFILLQQIIEAVSGEGLDTFCQRRIYQPIGAKLYFNPLDHGIREDRIAPTQYDQTLRKQVIRGTVDDESAACLGGVSGNAGLFGSAIEVAKVCRLLLQQGNWEGKQIIPAAAIHLFTTTSGVGSRRFLGFDRQTGTQSSPTAPDASASTYGHLGFTGTCFWIDPQSELVFIFLSNRTYPSRSNQKINQEKYRKRLHELAYEALGVNRF